MTLSIGAKLGPYETVAAIGAGGMGEVYRARDTRLGRDVALKVLPEAMARDAERMARMRREAQVLASLNHPNIAAIYGFEDSGNTHALVMELVEGPTLAEKIFGTTKGSVAAGFSPASSGKSGATGSGSRAGLALDEALPLAKQICDAIEYAHERGVIHRDLKPSNVKVTLEGQSKVLDFGLAKAIEGDAETATIDNSPTLSAMATHAGFLMGTAAYMSPEQAKGKAADRRADIWAFGVVLYEMLSGKRLFTGETTSDTLASVIKSEPDWSLLPAETPWRIRELLVRCLKKDPRQRLQSIGDARIAIEEVLSGAAAQSELGATTGGINPPLQSAWRRALPWASAAVLAMIAALLAFGYFLRAPVPAPAVVSEITAPANSKFVFSGTSFALPLLSPDGKFLVFPGFSPDGHQVLWLRALDSGTARSLDDTDAAAFPFWSPDSRSLGFFAHGKLNRMDVSGGPPVALCDVTVPRGGSWGRDGTILFTPNVTAPVFRIPASGGTPQAVTKLRPSLQERSHRWAQFLPDNKHFLFFVQSIKPESMGVFAGALDGGEPKLILRNSSAAFYAPPGYLLFVRDGALMVQRFDAAKLTLVGEATPLVAHVGVNLTVDLPIFSASQNGMLIYASGNVYGSSYRLLWFDRSGKQIAETGTPGVYFEPSISPDGRRLAVSAVVPGGSIENIWVFDLARGVKSRLTFSGSIDRGPAWSPDGKSVAFYSNSDGAFHIYQSPADGTGSSTPLVAEDKNGEYFPSFSFDARYILYSRLTEGHKEIWASPLFGDRKAFPLVQNQFGAGDAALSPNGKWLAYASLESGTNEIYVVPFQHGNGKWEVSTSGGEWPKWRRDGKELFYISPDNRIMSAEISEADTSLVIGKVQPLFQTSAFTTPGGWPYDVTGDGKKFVVVSTGVTEDSEPLTLVTNWPALLKKQ